MTETAAWIAQRIRQARREAKLTQADLADRLNLTQTAVSYWESAKRAPGLDDLIGLSDALARDVTFFLPPPQARRPVAAILRAETQRLAWGELDWAVDNMLDSAEREEIPLRRLEIRSRQPAHAANELVEVAGIKGPPVDVSWLAEMCGVLVLRRPFPDPLSGLILEQPEGAVIGINSEHARVRQRFSTAHELGHHLLRHGETFHIDVSETPRPDQDYEIERAANDFAAELLMPRRFVSRAFADEQSTPMLARTFDVSEIAMGYRLVNLGLR
jgi:Zn-dependent peptidase ImmA (M78 family)/DNA-binding XRE family transcriptional regulator